MDFTLSEEQQMLADMAERFVRDQDNRMFARDVEATARKDWPRLAELGWLALSFPEKLGGIGGDIVDMAVLATSLGRGYVLSPLIVTSVLCGAVIARSSQAAPLAEQIIEGSLRLALAHDDGEPATEPVIAMRDGESYRLTGRKFQVLSAELANRVIVSARIAESDETALFLVDSSAIGLSLTGYDMLDGTRAADLLLDGIAVAQTDLLLSGQEAQEAMVEAQDRALLAWLGEAVGAMEASLEICGAYIKERVQFGQPIGSFQALQQIIASMFVDVQDSRSALYYALANFGEGESQRSEAISAAKVAIGNSAKIVSRQGIQLHGGYGMTDEFPISHHFRRLMVIEKLFGDVDFHAARIADMVLGEEGI